MKNVVLIYDDNKMTAHGSSVKYQAKEFRRRGATTETYTLDEFQRALPTPKGQRAIAVYLVPPVPMVHRFHQYPPLLDEIADTFGHENTFVFLDHEYTFCADDLREKGFRVRTEVTDFPTSDEHIARRLEE